MVGAQGFEPRKSSDNRFTVCSIWPLWKAPITFRLLPKNFPSRSGAGEWNRTINLLITSQLLCQLSHASIFTEREEY